MSDTSLTTPPTSDRPVRGAKRWLFRLAAVLLALMPFVLLEVVLIVLGVGQPSDYDDPFVGFSSIHPLFEKGEKEQMYVTTSSRQSYFGKQQFPVSKPADGFRIFCLGGSTVRGKPHDNGVSFVEWLEIELNGQDSSRQYRAVNCGGVSYASYRLQSILDEVLDYEADLIVVATGHNEFLEDRTYHEIKSRSATTRWFLDMVYSLRTVTLARQLFRSGKSSAQNVLSPDIEAKLDEASGYASYHRADQWWQDVADHYRLSLEAMVKKCRAMEVPIVLVNLGVNLRDCPPFKSENKPGLSPQQLTAWRSAFDLASVPEMQSDPSAALRLYQEAEAIDAEHGLLLFRMARCHEQLGNRDKASEYYRKARQWDVCPLRMREELHQILKEVATQYRVPLVDVERLLRERAPLQSPGFDLYVDHVHPTIASHQQIAQAIFAEMVRQQLVPSSARRWEHDQRRQAYRKQFEQLGPTLLAGSKHRITWLEKWARRRELAGEANPLDAQGYRRWAFRHLEIGRTKEALDSLAEGLRADSTLETDLLNDAYAFFNQGRHDVAQTVLQAVLDAPSLKPNRRNHLLVGMVLALERNERGTAEQLFRESQQTSPAESELSPRWRALGEKSLQELN